MTARARRLTVGGLFLAVLLVRLVYLVEVRDHPLFKHPVVDAQVYDALAERIASGEGYPLPVYATNPFYPYLLALFYRVFGSSPLPMVLVQLLLGAAGTLLLFDIGRRIGGFWTGCLALLLGGLYETALFYEVFLLPTAIGVFVNLLLLALLVRRKPGSPPGGLLAAGVLVGVGTLIQGNLILFLPILLAWLLLAEPKGKRLRPAGAALLGFLIVVLPVTARNLAKGGDLVLISSHSGINFYMGNNASARGAFSFPDEPIVLSPENINIYDSKRIAEKALGRELKPSEVSWYWTRKAVSWIAGDPVAYAALLGRKTALFWNNVEIPDNADIYFFRERVPILGLLPFAFGILAPFGVFGLVRMVRDRKGTVVVLFLAAQFLSALVFYTHSRYRVPFAVVLAAPAALGALVFARGIRRWNLAGRIWSVGALALLLVLFNVDAFAKGRAVARAFSLAHLANGLVEEGESAEAESCYVEALRLLPGYPAAHYGLGRLHQTAGENEEAVEEYRSAVREAPTFGEAYINLGAALHALGENEKALVELREGARLRPEVASARYNLGNVLSDLGRHEEAVEEYRRAAKAAPDDAEIARNLVNALERKGDLPGAEQAVREALGRTPASADLRNRLGDLLEKEGRADEALQEYLRAVEIDPRHSAAWNNIGLLRYHRGEIDAAVDAWRRILAYDPASPVAANLRMAEEARGAPSSAGGSR